MDQRPKRGVVVFDDQVNDVGRVRFAEILEQLLRIGRCLPGGEMDIALETTWDDFEIFAALKEESVAAYVDYVTVDFRHILEQLILYCFRLTSWTRVALD